LFTVVYHPEWPRRYFAGEGRVDVVLRDGRTLTGAMAQPYGGPDNPLSIGQVVDIYRKYCRGILSDRHIERTANIILDMENQPDLQELFDICTFRHRVA